ETIDSQEAPTAGEEMACRSGEGRTGSTATSAGRRLPAGGRRKRPRRRSDMEQRLSLITLGVADVRASRAFYERLGWKASSVGGDDVAFFQLGGVVLSVYGRGHLAKDAGLRACASSTCSTGAGTSTAP